MPRWTFTSCISRLTLVYPRTARPACLSGPRSAPPPQRRSWRAGPTRRGRPRRRKPHIPVCRTCVQSMIIFHEDFEGYSRPSALCGRRRGREPCRGCDFGVVIARYSYTKVTSIQFALLADEFAYRLIGDKSGGGE